MTQTMYSSFLGNDLYITIQDFLRMISESVSDNFHLTNLNLNTNISSYHKVSCLRNWRRQNTSTLYATFPQFIIYKKAQWHALVYTGFTPAISLCSPIHSSLSYAPSCNTLRKFGNHLLGNQLLVLNTFSVIAQIALLIAPLFRTACHSKLGLPGS